MLKVISVILLALSLCACGAKVQAPPSPQSIELTVARTLDAVQASIDQAKTLVPTTPAIKDPLNKIITSYNTARSSLIAYDTTKTGDLSLLNSQVNQISSDISALLVQFGAKK